MKSLRIKARRKKTCYNGEPFQRCRFSTSLCVTVLAPRGSTNAALLYAVESKCSVWVATVRAVCIRILVTSITRLNGSVATPSNPKQVSKHVIRKVPLPMPRYGQLCHLFESDLSELVLVILPFAKSTEQLPSHPRPSCGAKAVLLHLYSLRDLARAKHFVAPHSFAALTLQLSQSSLQGCAPAKPSAQTCLRTHLAITVVARLAGRTYATSPCGTLEQTSPLGQALRRFRQDWICSSI